MHHVKIFFASVGGGYGGDEGGWRDCGDGEEREWVSWDLIWEAGGSIVNKHVEQQQGTIISTVDYKLYIELRQSKCSGYNFTSDTKVFICLSTISYLILNILFMSMFLSVTLFWSFQNFLIM